MRLFEVELQKPRNLSSHDGEKRDLGGVGPRKKPKDLSAHEREEREHGEGRDVYSTLLQSDTL